MAWHSHMIHHRCTLPSILDTYRSHDRNNKIDSDPKPPTQKRFSSIRKKEEAAIFQTVPGVDPDPEALMKHRALQDQHHLEVYWSMYRLRDEKAHHYAALLREKVQRQRRDIRQREEDLIQAHRNRAKKRKRRQEDQKLTRSTVAHDETHLKSLPKTTCYLTLELQNQLVQHGCLRSRQEQERFKQWLDQNRRGSQLRRTLTEMVIYSKSAPNLRFEAFMKQGSQLPKDQISGDDKDPQEDAATERLASGAPGGSTPTPGGKQAQERHGAKQTFPKIVSQAVRRPRFATLQPSFMESLRTTVLPSAPRLPEKRSLDSNLLKLRLMHSLSLSHMAYSQRLLGKGGPIWEEGYQTRHLIDYLPPQAGLMEADQIIRQSLVSSLSQRRPSVRPSSDEDRSQEASPALSPRASPTLSPRASPTLYARASPTLSPRASPALSPRASPTLSPRASPALSPRASPALSPRASPALSPRASPTLYARPEPEASSGDREPCDDGRPVSVHPDEPLSMKDMHQQNTSLVKDCSVKMWQNYA